MANSAKDHVSTEDQDVSSPALIDHRTDDKLATLQHAIKGKKIMMTGHVPLTAEAFEHQRKVQMHEQLKLARKLRAIMENALAHAKEQKITAEAREIFHRHRNEMLQLASLSNAVVNGYTLDSYNEYIELEKEEDSKEMESFVRSQTYLNDIQRRMIWEKSPLTSHGNDSNLQLEQAREVTGAAKETPLLSRKSPSPQKTSSPKPIIDHNTAVKGTKKSKTMKKKKSQDTKTKKDTSKSLQSSLLASSSMNDSNDINAALPKKKKSSANKNASSTKSSSTSVKIHDKKNMKVTKHGLLIDSKKNTKTSELKARKIVHALAQNIITSISGNDDVFPSSPETAKSQFVQSPKASPNNTKPVTTKPVKPKSLSRTKSVPRPKQKPKQTRKCHHCKEVTTDFFTCRYWFPSGTKCKKSFCDNCLEIYKVEGLDKDDWHCPSCLKLCKCVICMREREREEREAQRATKRRRLRS
jgi:hypothetical protein